MDFAHAIAELKSHWFPHTPNAALDRIVSLLESGSPLLINRAFERCAPMGCLATQIAWHHPETSDAPEAGITWLAKLVGLNPGTSQVIRAWDDFGMSNWSLRMELLAAFRDEKLRRQNLLETIIPATEEIELLNPEVSVKTISI